MEFLRPNLTWVGNRCYRTSSTFFGSNTCERDNTDTPYEFDDTQERKSDYIDEPCEDIEDIHVEELPDNSFRTTISIPNTLFKFIIGTKGMTKKRIEAETRTKIIIPKPKVEDDIVIKGVDKKGVTSAYTRLSIIADSSRQKQMFTHFISIPLTNENIEKNFETFKENVLQHCFENQNIDSSLFQNALKLHFTVGTLVLLNDADRSRATDLLHECKDEIIMPLIHGYSKSLCLKGLEYMNDDPSEVDVLYAKVLPSNSSNLLPSLQVIVDHIAEKFKRSGLMIKQYDHVKIHATIMNTLFRSEKDKSDSDKSRGFKTRECFNANMIMQKYKEFEFGEIMWNEVHLSQRYTTAQSGYYKATAKIDLV
ncbi:Activating signal cointegrator 1 complex subunit 1 [Nymphon striatum]|nr:Activating signal cointegrator 1 complex subunit 1 [Nymphon striatum]